MSIIKINERNDKRMKQKSLSFKDKLEAVLHYYRRKNGICRSTRTIKNKEQRVTL